MLLVACHWPLAKQTRRPRRYAQATTRSKTTQHIIHDNVSPRPLAEPWRREERCVRAGENESPRRLSSAVSPIYSTRSNMHFDTMRSIQRSFIHSTTMSLLYRVSAVFAPRDSEPARRGERLLSHVEMSGHELERRTRIRMPHSTYTGLYTVAPVDSILTSSSPSAQRMFPRPNTIS